MRALLVLALLALLFPLAAARADDPPPLSPADRDAIGAVVNRQLEAFRRDDAQAAYGYASPNIQRMFGDPPHFMAMVRQGYPPVYRPRSAHIGDIVVNDGRIVQRVDIVGPDGKEDLALYSMEREPDGSWRIDGCQLTAPDTVGT